MLPKPDIQEMLRQHVEYSEKAAECARLGLIHLKAGNRKKAEAAYKQAQRWHAKAVALEPG